MFIIFLGCSAVAEESENCNRIQFSFDDRYGISTHHNFTKQSFEKNGKPMYYTLSETAKNQNIQAIIWWNNENKTWLSQTMPYSDGNKITIKTKIKFS